MPDRALLDAAANGELRTPDGLERVAARMLEDTRARQAVDEFFSQWLRFDRMLGAVKDDGRYPEFTPELAAMMVQETRMLLGHLVWNDGNFMEAFTADYSFLNADLARLYGVPAPAGEFEMVSFPQGLPRAGILGQASFLASTAGPVETSPTARGMFMREQLLCQRRAESAARRQHESARADGRAVRCRSAQRMLAHVENQSCSGCHRLMDPIGFGLEKYDAVGRWRDQEAIEFGAKRPRRSKTGGGRRSTPRGRSPDWRTRRSPNRARSGRVLAISRVCQECVVKQMFRYAFGRVETAADRTVTVARRGCGRFGTRVQVQRNC